MSAKGGWVKTLVRIENVIFFGWGENAFKFMKI